MRLEGFVGPSYQLRSSNVDYQRSINLYPEVIESGSGKGQQRVYLKSTPGLRNEVEVGDGPIRLIHTDSIGRTLVVSGYELFRLSQREEWTFNIRAAFSPTTKTLAQATDVNTTTDVLTISSHGFQTGMIVAVSSSGTLPTGLSTTNYWVIRSDANTFKLATNLANAVAGTAVDITGVGSGTMTLAPVVPGDSFNIHVDDVDYATYEIPAEDNNFYTGWAVTVDSFATPIMNTVSTSSTYYVIYVDSDTIKLASSLANASSGQSIIFSTPTGAANTWFAYNVKDRSKIPTADAEFETASGPVVAASMSIGGDGRDSTTLFTDGSFVYVLYDSDPTNGIVFEGPGVESLLPPSIAASHVEWIDGYFIINELGSNRFYVSDIGGITFDALNFSSSEGDPDNVVALLSNQRQLWIFNEESTEVWVNTGNPEFPFERVQGGYIEKGCIAPYSVAKIEGSVFWIGRDKFGSGQVFMATGLQTQKVSTHAVEYAISTYADVSSARAYTYQQGGHSFYVLNFDEMTWVYDLNTGLWHERAYTNNGDFERHRADTHAYSSRYSRHLVGDYEDNRVYSLDESYYSDDGDEITRQRISPHLSNGNEFIFYKRLWIDMEVGVGLSSGQGSDPQAVLDWSDDGGHTWSSESMAELGNAIGDIGEYKTRVLFRRLGKSRDRIFRLTITDPVKVTLIDAHIDIEQGVA